MSDHVQYFWCSVFSSHRHFINYKKLVPTWIKSSKVVYLVVDEMASR